MNKLSKIIADIVRENVDDAYFASSNTPFRLPLNPQVGNIVFQNQIPHDRSVISGALIIALYVFFAYTKDHFWLMIDSSRPNTLTWKSHFDFCCYTRRSGELLYGTSQKYCGSCHSSDSDSNKCTKNRYVPRKNKLFRRWYVLH